MTGLAEMRDYDLICLFETLRQDVAEADRAVMRALDGPDDGIALPVAIWTSDLLVARFKLVLDEVARRSQRWAKVEMVVGQMTEDLDQEYSDLLDDEDHPE